MARHVNAGGNPHDELGSHIVECVKEMYDLRNFVRKLNRADGFVNEDSADIISDAKKRYKGLKETVATLSKPKGYKIYSENFKPTESTYDESDIDELKSKLIRNVDQTELESLLPTVLKARKKVQEDMGPLHDIIQGKTKIVVTPNEEEDGLIKKQFEFVKANKFKKPNDTEGLDHTENPTHSLIRRILTTISVRTKNDDLARSIFNLDDSFENKHDAQMMTAVASKWLKGDVEVQDFDPKYKMKEPVEEFEKWADSVVREGTWHLPTSDEDVAKFKEIMAKPIIAGEDGQSATDAIGEVFGDDELFDNLSDVDSNADARPVIWEWLKIAAKKGYDDEHQPFLDAMLATAEAVEKELPIEAEAAVEEIEAREEVVTEESNRDLALKDWYQNWSHLTGGNGDELPKGWMLSIIDTGITTDGIEQSELDMNWEEDRLPITDAMKDDFKSIMGNDDEDTMREAWQILSELWEAYEPKMDWEKPNPETVLTKGMADELAKEIEDELEDEEEDTDESLNHMKKLAGIMSSNKALRPKKTEHQTTPRSIHKRK
jgi:hypothetical protein